MLMEDIKRGTKEADDLACFILRTLYEVAAMYSGCKLKSIQIYKVDDNGNEVETCESREYDS